MELVNIKAEESEPIFSVEQHDTEASNTNTVLLHTLTMKCKEEMESNCLHKPLGDYMLRVAYYTGLSRRTINQAISKDLEDFDENNKYFRLNELKDIFKYIADSYTKKEIPTYKNIYNWYKSNNAAMTFYQFQYMLNCLGFDYHKTEIGKEILIEDPSLTFKRYLYLKEINNLRLKSAPIYYIDERFFDNTYTFSRPWLNNIDISTTACNGYVFFHAVSKQGLLNGFFCSPTTKRDFVKWLSHIVMPLLEEPSIIIMDSNDLHGSLTKTITKYSSKSDMLQYLRQKNIPCSEHLHKAELYNLISKCTVNYNCYDIDEILKAHGHRVLRMPPYFHDLSMTHYLWEYITVAEPSLFANVDLAQSKIVLMERLNRLSEHMWENFHEALVTAENEIISIDSNAHKALEENYYNIT